MQNLAFLKQNILYLRNVKSRKSFLNIQKFIMYQGSFCKIDIIFTLEICKNPTQQEAHQPAHSIQQVQDVKHQGLLLNLKQMTLLYYWRVWNFSQVKEHLKSVLK